MRSFDWNNFYGQEDIMRRYAGVPDDVEVDACIIHSTGFRRHRLNKTELNYGARFLCYTEDQAKGMRECTNKPVVVTAHPIVYLEVMNGFPLFPQGKGSLFLVAHSCALTKASNDIPSICRKLRKLPDRFHPITVQCYGEYDFEENLAGFSEEGFKVVTAGALYDLDFYERQRNNFMQVEYILTNCKTGSHVPISLYYHRKLQWIPDLKPKYDRTKDPNRPHKAKVSLDGKFEDATYDPDYGAYHLGAGHVHKPHELYRLLTGKEKPE